MCRLKPAHDYCHLCCQEWPQDGAGGIAAARPADQSIITEDLFTGCFGGGPGRLRHSAGSMTLRTGDMYPNKTYTVRVEGAKAPGRVTVAELLVTVLPAVAPRTRIL